MNSITPKRVVAIWKENAFAIHCPNARRKNLRLKIKQSRISRQKESDTHLEPWLLCFDEGLLFLNLIYEWIWEVQKQNPSKQRGTIAILTGRVCSLAAAVRLLVVSGYEDPAHPILRTFHETIDLLISILTDDSLNVEYSREEDAFDDTEFWRRHVAFKRINAYLKKAGKRAGMADTQVESWLTDRDNLKTFLSGSTHTAAHSVFRTSIVPSLIGSDMYAVSTFGSHSIHSPGLLLHTTNEILNFGTIFIKLLESENPPTQFEDTDTNMNLDSHKSMIVGFLTLQCLLTEEQLPPLPGFPSDEEDV